MTMDTGGNSMLREVASLPDLLEHTAPEARTAVAALPRETLARVRRILVVGCGDSHFAGIATRLAVEPAAGAVAEPFTSLHMSRFGRETLRAGDPAATLVVGISVSGSSARTVEAVEVARAEGAVTVGLTARPGSRIAEVADHTLLVQGTPWVDPEANTTPGVRSWAVNLVTLLLLGAEIGRCNGRGADGAPARVREAVAGMAEAAERTIALAADPAQALVDTLHDVGVHHVLGGGPHLGTAHFGAAKIIEACGEEALGQDVEEWAHLQFYVRFPDVATIVVTAAGRDLSRAAEVAAAARTIGRPTVAVVPADRADRIAADAVLPFAPGVDEAFGPLLAAIPLEIYAAARGAAAGEPYFRTDRPISVSRIKGGAPVASGT